MFLEKSLHCLAIFKSLRRLVARLVKGRRFFPRHTFVQRPRCCVAATSLLQSLLQRSPSIFFYHSELHKNRGHARASDCVFYLSFSSFGPNRIHSPPSRVTAMKAASACPCGGSPSKRTRHRQLFLKKKKNERVGSLRRSETVRRRLVALFPDVPGWGHMLCTTSTRNRSASQKGGKKEIAGRVRM